MKTKEEISAIVSRLISIIKEMPDGARTTTAILVCEAGMRNNLSFSKNHL